MELDALAGAANSIVAHHPIMLVEMIKSDRNELRGWLERLGYAVFDIGMNFLAVHSSDKCQANLKIEPRANGGTLLTLDPTPARA